MDEKLKRFFEHVPEKGQDSLKEIITLYMLQRNHGMIDISNTETQRYMEHFQTLLDEMIGEAYESGHTAGYSDGYNSGHADGFNANY